MEWVILQIRYWWKLKRTRFANDCNFGFLPFLRNIFLNVLWSFYLFAKNFEASKNKSKNITKIISLLSDKLLRDHIFNKKYIFAIFTSTIIFIVKSAQQNRLSLFELIPNIIFHYFNMVYVIVDKRRKIIFHVKL